ncbi:MAG: hypothetical protein E7584_07870 [Ruminococcaceae bacterium]|nr:hypothetical protein [Oscillospiraceae bacterium]
MTKPIIRPIGFLFAKLKFNFKFKKPKKEELPENYIVLSNHVTDYDPILVGLSFPHQMYFVASEHITPEAITIGDVVIPLSTISDMGIQAAEP